jgi:UPF0176 protein
MRTDIPPYDPSHDPSPLRVATFYRFVTLPDKEQLRDRIQDSCDRRDVKGTILLADEGINGTIVGTHDAVSDVLTDLQKDNRFSGLDVKYSFISPGERTFYRMKVRLKREIVTLGVEGTDPNEIVGTYVDPEEWNALISDPDVTVVDTRNQYEVDVGSFRGAINPHTESFRDFPRYASAHLDPSRHRKVAMFCTGGIRCEKATSWMLKQGFEEVYHLRGGILRYLEEVPEDESLWEGECYVFDHRVTVDHGLKPGSYDLCFACRRPLSDEDKERSEYRAGVSCHRCIDEFTDADRVRFEERARQIALAEQAGETHLGAHFGK